MFNKNKEVRKHDHDKKALVKLAKRYIKVLESSDYLPENSREMYEVIKKAGLR